MTWPVWLLVSLGGLLAAYAAFVLALIVLGRREDARAAATFVPDCAVLMARLLRDPRVPKKRKALLAVLAAYLACPIDLVPDFIPVAGQLDDAILVALVLRYLLRGGDDRLICEHWPGPPRSLSLMLRLAGASA